MRIVIAFLAALVAALGTGYYVYEEMRNAPVETAQAVEAPPLKEVFVPAAELSAGSIIKPEHLGRMPVDDAALTPEMVVAGTEGTSLLVGSVARQVLPKGVPIARSAVVQPGDRGFLAAVLPQGKRAISIPITEVAGISGLVLPGDRVDIILTYSLIGADIDSVRDVRASETVMRNIRVLALDRRLHQAEAGADGRPQTDATPIARTATLQVSPREAEMITLATSLGDLSLVLNSVHDGGDEAESGAVGIAGDDSVSPRRMTLDSDVTSLLQNSGPEIAAPTSQVQRIQIVRGASAGAIELGEQALAAAAGLDDVAPDE